MSRKYPDALYKKSQMSITMDDKKAEGSEKTIADVIENIRSTKERLKRTELLLDESPEVVAVKFYPTKTTRQER